MPKKLTYEFVKKYIENYGLKLISKKYVNSTGKILILCNCGNEYPVNFSNFKGGSRCPICSEQIKKEKLKHSYEYIKNEFEKRDYVLLSKEYINNKKKLKALCDKGHEVNIAFALFQGGCGCRICGYEKLSKKFRHSYKHVKGEIEKAGCKLLSEEYINSKSKLKILCRNKHEYQTTFDSFTLSNNCPECNKNILSKKFKLEYDYVREFIENEGYKLISKEYENSFTKLKVKCDKGHEYPVTWGNFKSGYRCPSCYGNKKLEYEQVKNEFEKYNYKLLSKYYKNTSEKLKVKCDKGHEYPVRYNDFQQGYRCPVCFTYFSKAEKEIAEYLKSLNINIIENDRNLIHPLELDIVIPDKKLAIEYCGLYWHSEKYKNKNYHKEKLEKTNKAGYRLITIFEDEWMYKKDIVKNRLKYFLGLNTERIHARKCEIREITRNESKEFVDKYHIQGHANATIYLGAFYNKELMAVNTFIKKENNYELNRFCVNKSIVGIASKFIKYFQRNYYYNKTVTFADLRWSEGNLYEKIGFVKDKELEPDYSYFENNGCVIRHHKFGFRHKSMKKKLENYNIELSEHQNMINNNWLRIYDCGKIRYSIKNI